MKENKDLAIKLRLKGQTYNQISNYLKIPKSTLSGWFKDKKFEKIKNINYNKAQKKWSKNISIFNKQRTQKIWIERKKERRKFGQEINHINNRELLLIGVTLYWAEGYKKTKWCISFCNSDPDIIRIIMKFFRIICRVPENKFKLRIQTHPNISENAAKLYWSKITSIPFSQFNKTQISISKSSKRKRPINTLPYGTIHVLIFDKKLVDRILGLIDGLKKEFG